VSPARLNVTLQGDFVRTEVETGLRMLALARQQQRRRQDEAARESLNLAKVALSGAERHLAAVSLPPAETRELSRDLRVLRRRLEAAGSGASRGAR
jgi:hypothetical protein